MRLFILIISLLVSPSQLLQANNMVHAATLQNLAAGKVSLRAFLNSRLAEVMKTNYQIIGKEIGLNPNITEVYTEYIDDIAEIAAQMNEAALVKINIWESMVRDDSLAVTTHDIVHKLEVRFEDAEHLRRITTFLREMMRISKNREGESFEFWSKQISSLLSDYKDLNPSTIGKMNKHLLEMSSMSYAEGVDLLLEVNHSEEFQKEFAVFLDGLHQEVLEKLSVDIPNTSFSIAAEELRNHAVVEIISSFPEIKERAVQTKVNLRLRTTIDLINEQVPKGVEPNIRGVARILAIKNADTVKRFTHAFALHTSLRNLFKQKTDMTVTTEKKLLHDVKELLHKYGASAFTAEELQELQEAVRIAAATQAAQ